MKNRIFKIESLLSSFPSDRDAMLVYLDKAKKYSTECGCALGGIFLTASVGVVIIYLVLSNSFLMPSLPMQIVLSLLFILTSSIVGKLAGISIAKIKLAMLYKHLIAKYHVHGE